MECSRCGGEAVVKRDNAVYCGKCALARDWQEIIHVVQNEKVSLNAKPVSSPPPSKPESAPANDPLPAAEADDAPAEEAPDPKAASEAAESSSASKADPFA